MKKRLKLEDFKVQADVKTADKLVGSILGDCHDNPNAGKNRPCPEDGCGMDVVDDHQH